MAISFDITQHKEIGEHVEKQVSKAIRAGLLSAAIRTVSHIKTEIVPKLQPVPFDRGVYLASWMFMPTPEGALVYNDQPYAGIIDQGVAPGRVKVGRAMIDALVEWIKRKGIGDGGDARSVAFAIANSLKARGIFSGGKGMQVVAKAKEKVPEFISEEVVAEIRRLGT